ncbi:unnamed protein product [Peronospora destructor]|uniref:Palmitoyltransferase n=1 Tax=Peronospora destructor TaxID=86335 RepID=A0AAV0T7T9_9STRA|nr:unnamed protein product [Peronospora destructor]CAI5714422.1 unnamed protein product [Peronospora destructor]
MPISSPLKSLHITSSSVIVDKESRNAECSHEYDTTATELVAGVFLSGMCLTCYALVGCTNPGIVTRIDMPPDDTYTYCDHCGSYRPEGALHCMDCQVCIEEYDHHCPWTSKCVGKANVRYFYAWLLFLVLAFVYEVIGFTTYLLSPGSQDNLDDSLEITFPVVTPAPRL